MTKTRESSHQAHLNWLMRLALTVLPTHYGIGAARVQGDLDRVAQSLALAHQIAIRYVGDHTSWIQIRNNVMDALAHMGRIAAATGFEAVAEDFVQARELCRAYLVSLTHEQRVQLASYDGFRNAHLTEETHDEGRDPALVLWLNPAYAPEIPAKARVQAKADERFAERYGELVVINAIFVSDAA
ncbi:hypothetical protein ACQP2T_61645 [Nonomuraea sp. CA-143628]|uniref:hypothetical protein n=1 Tax=Nonomuraea sp. CA-143628 TaxID=3239997 RepID=UPI003D8C20D8